MTHHQHAGDLAALEQEVRDGAKTADRAASELLDKVTADIADDERRAYLEGLREHASDGVGVRIVEQAIGKSYPEHPTT